MNSILRRDKIITILNDNTQLAVSASFLAEQLQVSRQVIVGDIALLRAKGINILSTPKGYIINPISSDSIIFKVACIHGMALAEKEIYTIVDNGGKLLDVIVEHPIYGQLVGQLAINSRYDANDFLRKIHSEEVSLLSNLTDGIHLHTISCKDEETAKRINDSLQEIGVLLKS